MWSVLVSHVAALALPNEQQLKWGMLDAGVPLETNAKQINSTQLKCLLLLRLMVSI